MQSCRFDVRKKREEGTLFFSFFSLCVSGLTIYVSLVRGISAKASMDHIELHMQAEGVNTSFVDAHTRAARAMSLCNNTMTGLTANAVATLGNSIEREESCIVCAALPPGHQKAVCSAKCAASQAVSQQLVAFVLAQLGAVSEMVSQVCRSVDGVLASTMRPSAKNLSVSDFSLPANAGAPSAPSAGNAEGARSGGEGQQFAWDKGLTGMACKRALADPIIQRTCGEWTGGAHQMADNFVGPLACAVVKQLLQSLCNLDGSGGSASLGAVPSVAKAAEETCGDLEMRLRCEVDAYEGRPGDCSKARAFGGHHTCDPDGESTVAMFRGSRGETVDGDGINGGPVGHGRLTLDSEVSPYAKCEEVASSARSRAAEQFMGDGSEVGAPVRSRRMKCHFDCGKCAADKVGEGSAKYMKDHFGVASGASGGGGGKSLVSAFGPNLKKLESCTTATAPMNAGSASIFTSIATIASGATRPPQTLGELNQTTSCGHPYVPNARGECAGVSVEEAAFLGCYARASGRVAQ